MSMLRLRWQDISGLKRVENAMAHLSGHEQYLAMQRAVNHTGDKARTVVTRTLAKQTGLKYGVIRRAIRTSRAWGASASSFSEGRGSLQYVMWTKGGDISLKFFGARETRKGVTAAPFGNRKLFAGAFIKAGHFPKRVTANGLNGHVYRPENPGPTGKSSWPRAVEFVDSGVIIPAEMVKGATAAAFTSLVEAELPPRVMHEIMRIAPGVFG